MIKKYIYIILTIGLIFICSQSFSQIKSIGVPSITSFNRLDYNASTQNWAAIQDKRGVMFFGNNDGVLEFDGVNWRLIQMPNNSRVRSIATDKKGTIYIGAFEEFGYLEVGLNGKLNYVSLIEKVPQELRNCGEIWKIYETESGIIFQTFTTIFLLKDEKIKTIAQNRDFHFSFYVNDEIYITEINKGLLKLKDEKLIPVKGGHIFNNNIWAMLPFDNSRILIGTTSNGLYILENETLTAWNTPVNDFFKQNQIYCATKVKDYFAFGTILSGLLIIDNNGAPIQLINTDKGLQNNTVLSIYADNYDNLWLGLDNGIDYITTNSPFTNIVDKSKIGAGYSSYIFQNKLYLGTNQGLFYTEWNEAEDPLNNEMEFEIVENTQGQVWDLFEYDNKLFCGHHHGTYIVNGNKAELISDVMGGWQLFDFPDVEKTLFQGTYSGLLKYDLSDNSNIKPVKIEGFNESCRSIETYLEKDKYILWISHIYKGIFKIELNKELDKVLKIDLYNSKSELATDYDNNVLKFYDQIIFSNENGIFNFDNESQKFVPNKELMELFGKGIIRKLVNDKAGHYLFIQDHKMGLVKKLSDGSYKVDRVLFESFTGSFINSFEHILPYKNENTIIATEEGFAHLNSKFIKDTDIPFYTLIRSVETLNDSILFGGAFKDSIGHISNIQSDFQIRDLHYKLHNLKFEFSATHYENMKSIEYKYFLEGFDEEWSDWTKNTNKEYTNLKEGTYSFQVKAKNVYNNESEISSFKFVINPPWYRSIVSYILYLFIIVTITWIFIRTIRLRIEKEKKFFQLKQEKELHQQQRDHENEVLSAQQEIVKLRNEKLRIENEKNRAEVELKTKELASYAMQVTQKNESLFEIKEQLKHISQKVNPDAQKYLQKLIRKIEQNTKQKDDWEKFEVYFDQVYEDFIKRLREHYPVLTPTDVKLCAYLRMNLSTKEIAPLLNISIRGVEVSRYRLRKKLGLPQKDNLIDFMMNM